MRMKSKRKEKLKILMVGPFPPPAAGASVSFEQIANEIKKIKSVKVKIVKTWHNEHSRLIKMLYSIKTLYDVLYYIKRFDVIILFACQRAVLYFAPVINLISKYFRKPFMIRKFGGNFDFMYKSSSILKKAYIRNFILSANLCLFQSRREVEFFKKHLNTTNIAWHANSRPIKNTPKHFKKTNLCRSFIYLGRVTSVKGIKEIVKASNLIDENIKIDIYGSFGNDINQTLFENNQKVNYCGLVPPNLILETMKNYDALLLPTYFEREGYPGVIIEAYSIGIPVIATKWKAIPEIVDNSSGILIKPRDYKSLKSAIQKLIDDNDYYKRLCKGAKKKSKDFSLSYWTRKLVEYCQLINSF